MSLGARGLDPWFLSGVCFFLEWALPKSTPDDRGQIRCPCSGCKHNEFYTADVILSHLCKKGLVSNCHNWIYHGEALDPAMAMSCFSEADPGSSNLHHDTIIDSPGQNFQLDPHPPVEEPPNLEAKKFYDMLRAANEPIWDGCKHSQIYVVPRLLNIKSKYNLSEKCFDQIAQLMKEAMPSPNRMINNFDHAKKSVIGLGLPAASDEDKAS